MRVMLTIIIALICWVLRAPSTFHELFILFTTILWGRLIVMFLFSQGNRGSERLSGLPRFTQQINSCPWIQTWVCSTLKPVLLSLCLYHIAVVLHPCLGSWCSAWNILAFDATLQSAPELLFSCPSQVCTTSVSWLLCSDAEPLATYSTELLLIGLHGSDPGVSSFQCPWVVGWAWHS